MFTQKSHEAAPERPSLVQGAKIQGEKANSFLKKTGGDVDCYDFGDGKWDDFKWFGT